MPTGEGEQERHLAKVHLESAICTGALIGLGAAACPSWHAARTRHADKYVCVSTAVSRPLYLDRGCEPRACTAAFWCRLYPQGRCLTLNHTATAMMSAGKYTTALPHAGHPRAGLAGMVHKAVCSPRCPGLRVPCRRLHAVGMLFDTLLG